MRKVELDEMQLQKKNKIGNQAFILLFYLLMIDIGLYGFGFRWLQYPVNVFVIMLSCMTYYLVRVIWNNAYLGPKAQGKSTGRRIVYITAIIGFLAAVSVSVFQKNYLKAPVTSEDDNGAIILFIFSAVSLIIATIVGIISRKRNSDTAEK